MKMVIDRVKRKYSDAVISELDGVTVYYPEWKMTIRGSNTEPLFRINIETKVNTTILNPQLKLEEAMKLILD